MKKCFRCEIIQVIENFNKDKNRKDGVCPQCINCQKVSFLGILNKIKKYNEQNKERRNIYLKNKTETDVKICLITNTKNKICKSLKGMRKQSSTKKFKNF